MIRLYTDENVDRRIVRGLRRRAVDVLTAAERSRPKESTMLRTFVYMGSEPPELARW